MNPDEARELNSTSTESDSEYENITADGDAAAGALVDEPHFCWLSPGRGDVDQDVDIAQVRIIEDYVSFNDIDTPGSPKHITGPFAQLSVAELTTAKSMVQSFVMVSDMETLPAKARLYSDCRFSTDESAPTLHRSAHTTHTGFFRRQKKHKDPMPIVFKVVNGKLAQLEAWFCACHRLLTPECVPKARVVYDKGQVVGIFSEMLRDFKAIGDEKITPELLNFHAARLARIIISAYLLEEDDLHRFNFSLKYRVDFDGLFWSLMHTYKGKRFWTSPEKAFDVKSSDVRHLPNIHQADPYYWPTKSHAFYLRNDFSAEECAYFAALETNAVFIHEKFKLFLKFMILEPAQFTKLASLFLDPREFYEDPIVQKLEVRLIVKQQQLRDALADLQEFKQWLEINGDNVFQEIQQENKMYNQRYKNEKYAEHRINLETCCKAYHELKEGLFAPSASIVSLTGALE